MLICNHGDVFDEPEREEIRERVGDQTCLVETVDHCPVCGSTYIEEAAWCKNCGEWRKSSEMDGGLCAKCQDNASKLMYSILESDHLFSQPERDYIKNRIEGIL